MKIWSAVLIPLLGAGLVGAAESSFAIREGDRVVIYGDSITAGAAYQGYPRYLEAYVRTRFPRWTTRIWNRGQSGDRASNTDRFQRDCLSLKPEVILFNMGMNDAAYTPAIAPGLRRFADSITHVAALARQSDPEVRLVLISPILYENRASGALPFYPYVLRSYARAERDLARRLQLPYIDLNRAYGQTIGLADAIFPGSTCFSGDGIHPLTMGGHLFIAVHILKGLGAGEQLAATHIDAQTLKVAAAGARAEQLQVKEGTISFDRTLSALPFPVVDSTDGIPYRDRAVAFLLEVADDLNRDSLRVTGLPARAYALRIDDRLIAELSTDELADGVNLSQFFNTPDQDQAVTVSEAVGRKQILEGNLWRLSLSAKADETARARLEEELQQAMAAVSKTGQPALHHFALSPLDHEVDRYQRYEQLLDISGPPRLSGGEDGSVRQEIKVTVRNLSLLRRRVEFFWSGTGATPATMVSELAEGERKEFVFALALNSRDPAPHLKVKHQPVDRSFPPLIQEYAPVRIPRLDVPRAATAIKIDGDLAEWQQAAVIDLESYMAPVILQQRAGPGDFGAVAQVLWNEESLAVGVTVQDQDHVSHFTDDRFSWDDAVTVSAGRASYTLALTGKGPAILPENAAEKGVRFAVSRQGLETRYELALPWPEIAEKQPEAGADHSFNVTVHDRDRDESHKTVRWCGTLDRAHSGTIRLREAKAEAADSPPDQ